MMLNGIVQNFWNGYFHYGPYQFIRKFGLILFWKGQTASRKGNDPVHIMVLHCLDDVFSAIGLQPFRRTLYMPEQTHYNIGPFHGLLYILQVEHISLMYFQFGAGLTDFFRTSRQGFYFIPFFKRLFQKVLPGLTGCAEQCYFLFQFLLFLMSE